VGAGFVAGTLPVVSAYGSMFRRLLYLSGHGHSEQTWPVLLSTSMAWQAFLAVTVLLAAWNFRRKQLPWVVFAAALLGFGLLATARNPTFRYLLPSAFVAVALLALVSASDRLTRSAQIAFLAITAVLLGKAFVNDVSAHRARIADGWAWRTAIESVVPRDAIVIYGWRSPVPSFALRVMSSDPQDRRDISGRYPREGHLDPWIGEVVLPTGVRRWDYLVVQDDDLKRFPTESYEIVTHVREYAVARSTPIAPER
jgi:hypothetical protein